LAPAEELVAPPCRELLLTEPVRARAAELAQAHPELAEICERLAEGIPVEGMESLAPALLGDGELELLVDCLPERTLVLLCDPERIRTRAHDLVATSEEFREASWAAAAVGAAVPIDVGPVAFRSRAQVRGAGAWAGGAGGAAAGRGASGGGAPRGGAARGGRRRGAGGGAGRRRRAARRRGSRWGGWGSAPRGGGARRWPRAASTGGRSPRSG